MKPFRDKVSKWIKYYYLYCMNKTFIGHTRLHVGFIEALLWDEILFYGFSFFNHSWFFYGFDLILNFILTYKKLKGNNKMLMS